MEDEGGASRSIINEVHSSYMIGVQMDRESGVSGSVID